jgi:hypothetical protein
MHLEKKNKSIPKGMSFNFMVKIKFVARLGTIGKDKFHILIPKEFHEEIRSLKGKQVKVIIDDQF